MGAWNSKRGLSASSGNSLGMQNLGPTQSKFAFYQDPLDDSYVNSI